MKKNKGYLYIILLLMFGLIFRPILTRADSGFDSSWDSGGSSWDSSSSWDSGSSWSSSSWDDDYSGSSSGGSVSGGTVVIALIIVVVIVIVVSTTQKSTNNRRSNNNIFTRPNMLSDDMIKNVDPNFDITDFKEKSFEIYKNIQNAWMNFDLDTIRDLVSDEIFNMYSMQLETLKVKGQKNMMENITLIGNYITDINIENNVETVRTVMTVECYDYLVDSDNKVIRGNKNVKMHYVYELTFTRSVNGEKGDECPNCGAPIDINSSGVCEYCNSTIINNELTWIMVKKEMLRQD